MLIICPFCTQENASAALVCIACARDIAVPVSLIDERDDLLRKRHAVREELLAAKRELASLMRGKQRRPL
jgi:hypothetical protein